MKIQIVIFSTIYLLLYVRKNLNILLFSFGKYVFENICKLYLQHETVVLLLLVLVCFF